MTAADMTAAEMTANLPTLPGDTLTSRCEYYRQCCQLDAHMRPERHAIMVAASSRLAAITMPEELAKRVRDHMQDQGIRGGPIISLPRSGSWTFLIRPDIPDDAPTFAGLFRMQVAVARPGTEIALPSPIHRHSQFRCWEDPPTDAYQPPGSVVLDTIYACARPSRHTHMAGRNGDGAATSKG